jgi:hypothetical protein
MPSEENDPQVLSEAGRASGTLLNSLHGASVTGASIDALGRLGRPWPRQSRLIVRNPTTTVQCAIPGALPSVPQDHVFRQHHAG